MSTCWVLIKSILYFSMSSKDTNTSNTSFCKASTMLDMELDEVGDNDDQLMDYKEDDSVLLQPPTIQFLNDQELQRVVNDNLRPQQHIMSPENTSQSEPQQRFSNPDNAITSRNTLTENLSLAQLNARKQKALDIHENAPTAQSEQQLSSTVIRKRDKLYGIFIPSHQLLV